MKIYITLLQTLNFRPWATGKSPLTSSLQLSVFTSRAYFGSVKSWTVGFSRRTFYRIKKLHDETGNVVKPRSEYPGRPRTLNFEDLQYLLELVHHRPDWFLDELTALMKRNRFVAMHYTTIHRELVRAGVSLKKLRKIASERNEYRYWRWLRDRAHCIKFAIDAVAHWDLEQSSRTVREDC